MRSWFLMANRQFTSFIVLFLLLFGVYSADNTKCPKPCSCRMKRGKLRVECRGRGLREVLRSSLFPSDMRVLDLSRNNITVLRRQFLDRHGQLERLILYKNFIRVIEDRAFVGLSKLTRLVLKQNNLNKLKERAFLGLPTLDTLDLSQNKIKTIDKTAFSGLSKLNKIVLSNNTFRTIENGTFAPLTNLKKITMRNVPLVCDCALNSFIHFVTHTRPLVRIDGTCDHSKTKFVKLKGENLCGPPPKLSLFPNTSQVFAVGDSFVIKCTGNKQPDLHLGWTKNKKAIRKKKDSSILVRKRKIDEEEETTLEVPVVTKQHAGTYTCSADRHGVKAQSVTIYTVSAFEGSCPPQVTSSDRGRMLWPITVAGTTTKLPCPSLSNNDDTAARRTCSDDGRWKEVNYGKCHVVSLYKELTTLLRFTAENDVGVITSKLRTLTTPSNIHNHTDITLVLNVLSEVLRKQGDGLLTSEVLDDLLVTFDNIMNVDQQVLYDAQRMDQSPSRLAARLELLSRKNAARKLSRAFSNIVIGSVELRRKDFHGKNCRVFFKNNDSLPSDGVQCQPQRRQDSAVSVHIPKTIFQNFHSAGLQQDNVAVQLLVYKNAKLFPNVVNNKTEEVMKDRNVSSSVISIQLAHIEELNLTEPITISFEAQAGTDPVISHFDFGEKVIGRSWSLNQDCHVNSSSVRMTTVHCRRLVNKNLAIMSVFDHDNVLVYPIEIVVYIGAVVAALFLLATLVTFAAFRVLRFNKDDILVLMNACFSLLVVVLTFSFGINRTSSDLVCLVVGLLVHFFFLASLLWLGSYVVCVTQKLNQPKDPEEEYNPVLRYYMVSWGVPAIICGITLAGDLKNYATTEYCWLTESAGLGAFVGPACLLFIINCVLLVRLHLLLARGPTSHNLNDQEDSEEEPLHTEEPAVMDITPAEDQSCAAEKASMTLSLVATWVVMSLVYVNFILAYLLLKFRHISIYWKLLSYVFALANIALGVSVFMFHCVARGEVRAAWKNAWKRIKAVRINWGQCGIVVLVRRLREYRKALLQTNGKVIMINGEEVKDSDRQSNITLPSSAALTNDVFVNGRPLSTARVSLLDEADFPPAQNVHEGTLNEVDPTLSEDAVNRRSQSSVYSDNRKSGTQSQLVSKPPSEAALLLEENASEMFPLASVSGVFPHDEIQADVTSKSESSAPTAIEVPLSSTPLPPDSTPSPRVITKPAGIARDTEESQSSCSLSDAQVPRIPSFKRKRSSESLNSRTSSARKFPLNPTYPTSSLPFPEFPLKTLDPKRRRVIDPSAMMARGPAPFAPPSDVAAQAPSAHAPQVPKNCYKDGREKPEPKQWSGNGVAKLTYVPVPHVSKIHRPPARNETSV